jgi:hypothetical protein
LLHCSWLFKYIRIDEKFARMTSENKWIQTIHRLPNFGFSDMFTLRNSPHNQVTAQFESWFINAANGESDCLPRRSRMSNFRTTLGSVGELPRFPLSDEVAGPVDSNCKI